MTTEAKQSIREQILKERDRVIQIVDKQIEVQKEIESEYDKYFGEISKLSSDFKLTKTPYTYKQSVYHTHGNERIIVDTITAQYNLCNIAYVGKLPERHGLTIDINVEVHRTNDRYGWCRTNHGYKLKLRFNYDREFYYKSVKTFIKRVEEKVEDCWNSHKMQNDNAKKRQMGLTFASQKFNNATVMLKNDNSVEVRYPNGVKANLYFNSNLETGEVQFRASAIIPPSNIGQEELINLFTTIGNM
jgi:hypothetical protein